MHEPELLAGLSGPQTRMPIVVGHGAVIRLLGRYYRTYYMPTGPGLHLEPWTDDTSPAE